MAADDSVGLEILFHDLQALSEPQLSSIEKLRHELETHIEALKKLLDKPSRSESSQRAVTSGMNHGGYGSCCQCRFLI